MNRPKSLLCMALFAGLAGAALAAEGPAAVPIPTTGSNHIWGDRLLFHQWRIQRNCISDECRLLDGANLRYASGSFDDCRAALEILKRKRNMPPMRGKAVIALHGLGDSRSIMQPLCRHLEEHGYNAFPLAYPSTRQPIAEHAKALAEVLENLEGIDEVNLVGYSMGNIVIRHYFGQAAKAHRVDPRIKRVVMLAPPNHGAQVATELGGQKWFQLAFGESAQELGRFWAWEEANLATPPCEFGIIAGGLGNGKGFNPLLPGDDDGLVTVDSARLEGARHWLLVPLPHSMIPRDAKVFDRVLRFVDEGRFEEP